jgi:hypothetical protein
MPLPEFIKSLCCCTSPAIELDAFEPSPLPGYVNGMPVCCTKELVAPLPRCEPIAPPIPLKNMNVAEAPPSYNEIMGYRPPSPTANSSLIVKFEALGAKGTFRYECKVWFTDIWQLLTLEEIEQHILYKLNEYKDSPTETTRIKEVMLEAWKDAGKEQYANYLENDEFLSLSQYLRKDLVITDEIDPEIIANFLAIEKTIRWIENCEMWFSEVWKTIPISHIKEHIFFHIKKNQDNPAKLAKVKKEMLNAHRRLASERIYYKKIPEYQALERYLT